MFFNKLFLLL